MSVRVNGVEIPEREILAEMQYHPASTAAAAQARAAESLVVRELLRQEAEALGFEGNEGIDALIESALDVAEPDEASCRAEYEAHAQRYRAPDLIEAQHILCAAPLEDREARAAAQSRAAKLLAEASAAPDRFGEIARAHSDCPSRAQDGMLGQVTRHSLAAEFATYLFALEPGEICATPVPTRYGFHVVRCLARADGRVLPYERVKDAVAQRLRECAWRRAIREYVLVLAARARIEGASLAGAAERERQ